MPFFESDIFTQVSSTKEVSDLVLIIDDNFNKLLYFCLSLMIKHNQSQLIFKSIKEFLFNLFHELILVVYMLAEELLSHRTGSTDEVSEDI